MQKYVILSFLSLFYINLSAQNLTLSNFNNEDISNDTVTYSGTISDQLLEYSLQVINSSDNDIDVKVSKEEITVVSGSENYFCWKDCYDPSVYESPDFLTIAAKDTNDRSFYGDYKPNGLSGQTMIKYKFFNANDENDTVTIMVIYDVTPTTSFDNEKISAKISQPYPNPSSSFISIKYNNLRNGKIEIYNLFGKKVNEILNLNNNSEIKLHSSNYSEGIFIFKIIENNIILKSGKLVFQ